MSRQGLDVESDVHMSVRMIMNTGGGRHLPWLHRAAYDSSLSLSQEAPPLARGDAAWMGFEHLNQPLLVSLPLA